LNRTPVKIRAIYADTDAMGIVYHTNYIRWFEIGRTELCRDMGILYPDKVHACTDRSGKIVRIPARISDIIRSHYPKT
jgi:YbgC/YbaW family acyl-CoA thioester hydrolase